jgi:hypothetical protein
MKLAHAVQMEEMYDSPQVLLQKIRYEEHWWILRAELKI